MKDCGFVYALGRKCGLEPILNGSGPLEALADGALGVDAVGFLGAADDGDRDAGRLQGFHRLVVGELARAEHHVVELEELLLAADFDAEAAGLDGLVGDAGDGLDTAEAERKAVDPARGLAEALAGLAFLALQEIERAAVAGALWFNEAAIVLEGAVDAPTLAEAVDGFFAVRMRKEVGHVESNAAGADKGHTLAHLHFARQDLVVRHRNRQVVAGDAGHAGPNAGAPCHGFKRVALVLGRAHIGGLKAGAEVNADTVAVELVLVVAQGLGELFFARDLWASRNWPPSFSWVS